MKKSTTPSCGLDGQCCSCAKWSPFPDDSERGRCGNVPMSMLAVPVVTEWSDGCKYWESNKEAA